MYEVNLIRKRIVPERQKRVIFSLVSFTALVYVLTILGVAFFSVANFTMIDVYAREIDKLEQGLSVLYPGTPTQDELATMIGGVKPDLSEIGALLDRQPERAAIWASIARAVPEGVWLTRVRVTDAQAQNGGKKKGKVEAKSRGALLIEGCAIATEPAGGSEAIKQFERALEGDDVLKGLLSDVESAETGMRRSGGSSVVGFEVTGALAE